MAAGIAAGCGGDAQPDPAADEAAIRAVLIQDEIGGPERCTQIYTAAYLEENWNKHVTAYPGDTPLEKCESTTPLAGVTEDDVEVVINTLDGDTAEASAQVRAQSAVGFTLVRDGDSWRIDGFSD